uniref:Ig-like domain-containing protein n=1 Tax=Chelonoidis abingdonii TaxID=106734 RepID=A0A8C0H6U1_CHEAB
TKCFAMSRAERCSNEDVKIDFEVTEMPPRFTTPLFDLEILENSEAVFECTVTGSPTPQVQWFKENTCITTDGRSYLVAAEKGSHCLKIQNVGHSDSGTYRCKAVNSVGEAICKSSLVIEMNESEGAFYCCFFALWLECSIFSDFLLNSCNCEHVINY